jgi:drug/metabolite transporter (DMT)-like permease
LTKRSWLIVTALAAVYIAWGSTYLGIRLAIHEMPPFFMCAVRFLIAGVLLIALGKLLREPWPTVVQWRGSAIAGILLLGLANGGVTLSERSVPSGIAALIAAATPLTLMIIERLRPDGERPGKIGYLGLLVGFSGVAVLLGPAFAGSTMLGSLGDLALLFGAQVCWALGTSFSSRSPVPTGLFVGSGAQALVAGLFHSVATAITGELPRALGRSYDFQTRGAIGYLIVVGSFVGYTAYAFLVREVPPSLASSNAYVNPVVAVILGTTIAHEPLTPGILTGASLVVGAVALLAYPQWLKTKARRAATA